jgi:hypothetical protein
VKVILLANDIELMVLKSVIRLLCTNCYKIYSSGSFDMKIVSLILNPERSFRIDAEA